MMRTVRFAAAGLLLAVAAVAASHTFARADAAAAAAFPAPALDDPIVPEPGRDTIVVAGGCFWGVQAVFQHTKGVLRATSGYAGGAAKNPSYELVSTGSTGHAESVEVVFDPAKVSLGQLLQVFFSVAHDPTELNRQGPDEGTQYRSLILVGRERQTSIARAYIEQLDGAKVYRHRIVTDDRTASRVLSRRELPPGLRLRHPFEPYIMINDRPKVEALRKRFPEL